MGRKEEIMAAAKAAFATEVVDDVRLSGKVVIHELSQPQDAELDKLNYDTVIAKDGSKKSTPKEDGLYSANWICACAYDEAGEKIFSLTDAPEIKATWPPTLIGKLLKVCHRVNGLGQDEPKNAEGSPTSPSE